MLTRMTDEDWAMVLEVFAAACSRRGDKGRNDRGFWRRCISSPSTTSPGAPCRPSSGGRLEALLAAEPGRGVRGVL